MKRAAILFGLLLAAGTSWAALQDAPAAIVARLGGTVEIHRSSGETERASVGTRLFVGDEVTLAEGGSATILKQTGEMEKVAAGGIVISAPEGGSEGGVFSKTVKVLAQASSSNARNQPNRQGMIRPIPGEPVPVAPRNGLTVMDPRPTFTWYEVADADGYRLQLRRADGGAVRRFSVESDTTWTLPDDVPPLVPGATYRWTVAPGGGGRVAREEEFRVVGADEFSGVSQTLASLSEIGMDPAGDGLFLAALAYRDAGLYYEAERALKTLAKSEEGTSALGSEYYLLLGEIYDAMGHLEEASAAFDRAEAATP